MKSTLLFRTWLALFAVLLTCALARSQVANNVIIQTVVPAEDNTTLPDHEGDYPAYIVLINTGANAVDLVGWSLTDDSSNPGKWVFPTGAVISPGGTVALPLNVFASGKNRLQPPYATNFTLRCGSQVSLYNPQRVLVSQVTVSGQNCAPCTSVIGRTGPTHYFVPRDASLALDWIQPAFDDSKWQTGTFCFGYEDFPLNTGLVLYATLDRVDIDAATRTIFDKAGPTFENGTYPANQIPTSVAPAQIAEGLGFNPAGSVTFAQFPASTLLEPATTDFALSFWAKPNGTATPEVLLSKAPSATISGYYVYSPDTATTRVVLTSVANATVTLSTTRLPAGSWANLAVVIDRAALKALLYRNGTVVDSRAIPTAFDVRGDANLYLAHNLPNATGAIAGFNGAMDDVAIWKRALTSVEVNNVFLAGNNHESFTNSALIGTQQLYGGLISTDVQAAMKGVNPSLYTRSLFSVGNPLLISGMLLRVNYDDGFIAYINGVEVARRNAPSGVPVFNSAAPVDRVDTAALVTEVIDISSFTSLLNAPSPVGGSSNLLAIQSMNATANDQRFLICADLCVQTQTQRPCTCTTNGTDFWLTFPGNTFDDPGNPLVMSLCMTGVAGTTGVVAIPGLGFSQAFSVPAAGQVVVVVPRAASLETSDAVEKKGIHVTATANVAIYGQSRIDYSTDTYLALPVTCIGSDYLVLAYKNDYISAPDLNGSQFGMVATHDNTKVVIIPSVPTGGHPANVPYVVTLNRGETYMLRNISNAPADLTGTSIVATQPISVFGGHRCANIEGPSKFYCDHIVEQLMPVGAWGTEYLSAPLLTRSGDTLRVLASQNGTTVSFNGVAVAGLNRGQVYETVVASAQRITATAPVLVAEYANSSDYDGVTNADPFMAQLQPVPTWLTSYRICSPSTSGFEGNFVNIIAHSASDAGAVTIDGAAPGVAFLPIGATGYVYAQKSFAAPGSHVVACGKGPIGLTIYGFSEYDSYGHPGGMTFSDVFPPSIACPPDVTMYCTDPGIVGQGCFAQLPNLVAQAVVTDNCCPASSIIVTQEPRPGTTVGIGDYTVLITARDCNQNQASCVVVVHVLPPWQGKNFPQAYPNPALEATVWGWNADPNGNGLTNVVEYAFGLDPNQPSGNTIGAVEYITASGATSLRVTYQRRINDPALHVYLEGSTEMQTWENGPVAFTESVVDPGSSSEFETVVATTTRTVLPGITRYFIRFRVVRN